MNKLEADYAQTLRFCELAGSVRSWKYEAVKIRLAKRTWYTPDFFLEMSDGSFEVHEVKGHWEDDARVKVKVAAELYPYWKFVALTRGKQGTWNAEEISP